STHRLWNLLNNLPKEAKNGSRANDRGHAPMQTEQGNEGCHRHANAEPVWSGFWEQSVLCEEHCQIEYDSDHGCGDCGKNCSQVLIATQILDEGSSGHDPKEAGSEGCPGGAEGTDDPSHHGIEAVRVSVSSHESHKLRDHDQGAGRCLGQCQAIEHLLWSYPSVLVNRLLCQICQHGVGPAEGHHGCLAEEDPLLNQDVVPS